MSLEHLFLSDEPGSWPELGQNFVRLLELNAGSLPIRVNPRSITTQLGVLTICVMPMDKYSAETHEDEKGYRPTLSALLSADWQHSTKAEVAMLVLFGRYISSRPVTNSGLYRNFDIEWVVQHGDEVALYGIDKQMHHSFLNALGPSHRFTVHVERWL